MPGRLGLQTGRSGSTSEHAETNNSDAPMLAAMQPGKYKEGEAHSLSSGGLSEEQCHWGILLPNAGLEQALERSTEGLKATLLTIEKNSSFKLFPPLHQYDSAGW